MTDQASTSFRPLTWVFGGKNKPAPRWLAWAWLGALYLAGIALWAVFLHYGRIGFNYRDWWEIVGPRLTFLKDALVHGILPLHISHASTLGGVTDRYFSIPDTFLAPQAVLLIWMDIGSFIFANQLLMYTLGFAGLLAIRRRFGLSLFALSVLYLLFNFNGHVLSHAGIGHVLSWGGYFLFPWFVLLILDMLNGDHSWRWVAKTAVLLFGMWLNGSFHQVVWLILFLILLAPALGRRWLSPLKAIGAALGLSLIRIVPAAIVSGSLSQSYDFYGGYLSLWSIVDSLVTINPPSPEPYGPVWTQQWWEISLYVGIAGAAFLLYFGVIRWIQRHEENKPTFALALPMLVLGLFSLGSVYRFMRILQVPLLNGERVTSRMFIVPFVFLAVLGSIELQRWLDKGDIRPLPAFTAVVLLFASLNDLWKNYSLWRLDYALTIFENHPLQPALWFAVTREDPGYVQAIAWGLAGTLVAAAMLTIILVLEKRGALQRMAERLRGQHAKASAIGRTRGFVAGFIAPEVDCIGGEENFIRADLDSR